MRDRPCYATRLETQSLSGKHGLYPEGEDIHHHWNDLTRPLSTSQRWLRQGLKGHVVDMKWILIVHV